jgi:iron complex transport system substrate-binding protein
MSPHRVVSFLPAATEIAYTLGLGNQVVAVSHECDFPEEAKTKPIVSRPALSLDEMDLAQIDAAIAQRVRSGQSIYRIDEFLLRALRPDIVLTQDLCQVCAPSGSELSVALGSLDPKPHVLWMSPNTILEIEQNVRDLAALTGRERVALSWIVSARRRLEAIASRVRQSARRPRVVCIEWADPIFCSGHWVPEMVEIAGGVDTLGRKGAGSVRVAWGDVVRAEPEVVVFMPCGFHADAAAKQLPLLQSLPGWDDLPAARSGRVYAVDADSYFARPGPRVIDGTELLAHLIHPELFEWHGSANAFAPSG